VVFGLCIFLQIDSDLIGLRLVVLFMGEMNSLYSIYDIFDDTIRRRVNASDASQCAEHTSCPSAFWGCIWFIFSLFLMGIAVFISIEYSEQIV